MSYNADQRLKLSPDRDAIPMSFVQAYVEGILQMALAEEFPETMREAAALRADHVMDLVRAWKERNK